ncbi:MAG: CoA transferase [Chloroflexi bacterium]|nr:CoA transferase [Chloroflexota bacterium]
MADGALRDMVVLELATGVAGPYCGRLLADLGAQVVKVEPPGGDPLRTAHPLVDGESAFFNWLNAGKAGVSFESGDPRIAGLAAHADIVLHAERGAAADDLDAALRAANPAAVVLSLSPYGRSGPRAGWEATELTEYATGGFHYFGGDPAREPISLPGFQAEFHAGMQAAIAALAGAWHARETGEGQCVEVSHQEAILGAHAWLTTMWTHQGKVMQRAGSLYAKCADGFVFLFNLAPYPNLFVLMERYDLLEDESLLAPLVWMTRFPEVLAAFSEWAATRTKAEIYHAGQELRIAISPVNTMADVAASPQLAAREWFGQVEVGGRTLTAPGFPYKLSETPCAAPGPAPKLGEHTAAVLSPGFAWANAGRAPATTGTRRSLPLEGLRVVEMTANWAGPIAGRHLADLGAEVVKVELATKPATRALIAIADDMWPEHYNRSAYFNKLNRNKRDVSLDLSKPAGRDVFLKLVAGADVLVENNAARVMTQLGVGYETLREVNPRLVMCSMSGYGSTGPERNYSAYGSNIETSSGLASVLGYGPGEYFGTGSYYADPVTGGHGAVAVLAALHARRTSGRGQWIDAALLEAVLPFFAQPFLGYSATGVVPEPLGNASPLYAPQGVYPTAGRDCWLALTVRDGRDFAALCGVIGREELARDPALATVEGRRARPDEIDAAIRGWAAARDHIAAAEALQAQGVPAAPVMPNWEIVTDNHLNDRGFFVNVRGETVGTFPFPGFAYRFEKTPGAVRLAAPRFAEHNHEVFSGLLGLSEAEIGALYAGGVTSDAPIYATGPGL